MFFYFAIYTIHELQRSENQDYWVKELQDIPGLRVKTYTPPGGKIGSSYGEFTKHYYHEEIESPEELQEFKDWQRTHQIFY